MQRFEDYTLLDQIDDDALGTVYRATRNGSERDELVLLRLFDKSTVDVGRFQTLMVGRKAVARAVSRPYLASSLELGVAGDQAFCVYQYVAGRSLRRWMDRAKQCRLLFPLDAALRIAGDLAKGLREACRKPAGDVDLLHGFLVPQVVMVTPDGEAKLCHLEAAPALRNFRATARRFRQVLPYLSPEELDGEDLHPSDDVYSLGALLYEMLTLKVIAPDPELTDEELGFSGARSDLRYFLRRSLAPKFRRFQSVGEWQRELRTLIATHDLSASSEDASLFLGALDVEGRQGRRGRYDTTPLTARDRELLKESLPADFRAPASRDGLRERLRQLAHLG